MENFITARHSFNAGDLITSLPGFQKIYKETGQKVLIYQRLDLPADYGHNDYHPIRDDSGKMVCMNKKMFEMLKPLIENQEYVVGFYVWEGQEIQFDIDLTRQHTQMPLPGGSIHAWVSLIFPQLECDLSIPWLRVLADEVLGNNKVYVNFTNRYRNPYISYYFLNEFSDKLCFIGTSQEHTEFINKWRLDIPHVEVSNFLEIAQILKGADGFLGNQSMCWHIADAMKVPRILEVCSTFPNTFPTGANGHSFITQGALEYQFSQLMKS